MERENYTTVSPHVLKRNIGHRVDVIDKLTGEVRRSGRIREALHHPVAHFWEFAWEGEAEWGLKLHEYEMVTFEFRLFEAGTGVVTTGAGYCVEVDISSISNGDYVVFKNDEGELCYGETAAMVEQSNGIISTKVDGVETGFASGCKVLKVMR